MEQNQVNQMGDGLNVIVCPHCNHPLKQEGNIFSCVNLHCGKAGSWEIGN